MFGDWTALTVFLYALGLILLIIEGVIPGFGLPGITGVICVIISVALITSNLYEALLLIIATIAIFALIIIMLYKLGYGSKYVKFLVLDTEQKKEEGYISMNIDSSYIGKTGITETILRPAGIVNIEDKRINAQSRGEFIEKDSKVVVIKTDGAKVTVKKFVEED